MPPLTNLVCVGSQTFRLRINFRFGNPLIGTGRVIYGIVRCFRCQQFTTLRSEHSSTSTPTEYRKITTEVRLLRKQP